MLGGPRVSTHPIEVLGLKSLPTRAKNLFFLRRSLALEKEVRFTEKKVDESWKENVVREKGGTEPKVQPKPELDFLTFLTSLGYQVLMHLGEIPHPETRERHIDVAAAKETIDLLIVLEKKTQGNRTAEEDQIFKNLIPELQMQFVKKTSASPNPQ